MHTWKTHLGTTLERLSRTHGHDSLRDIRRVLQGVLEADNVSFADADGRVFPDTVTLNALLQQPFTIAVRLEYVTSRLNPPKPQPMEQRDAAGATETASRFSPGEAPADVADIEKDVRYAQFVREFHRLERRHEFMWAGYIVRELLPRLGFPVMEAKIVLDRLRSEGIVTVSKVPNPQNPEFPATGVCLNHEHDTVKQILASAETASTTGSAHATPTTRPSSSNPPPADDV